MSLTTRYVIVELSGEPAERVEKWAEIVRLELTNVADRMKAIFPSAVHQLPSIKVYESVERPGTVEA